MANTEKIVFLRVLGTAKFLQVEPQVAENIKFIESSFEHPVPRAKLKELRKSRFPYYVEKPREPENIFELQNIWQMAVNEGRCFEQFTPKELKAFRKYKSLYKKNQKDNDFYLTGPSYNSMRKSVYKIELTNDYDNSIFKIDFIDYRGQEKCSSATWDLEKGSHLRNDSVDFCYPPEIEDCSEKMFKKLIYYWAGREINLESVKKGISFIHNANRFPFEPNLSDLEWKPETREIIKRIDRKNPNCFNEFVSPDNLNIKVYKTLRSIFTKCPETLSMYIRILNCGFKDVNLINEILLGYNKSKGSYKKNTSVYYVFRENYDRDLALFEKGCRIYIEKRSEKSLLFALKKLTTYDSDEYRICRDGFDMFAQNFEQLPKEITDIFFKEGFTKYAHDVVSKFLNQMSDKVIQFEYNSNQKRYERKIGAFNFILPKNSYELQLLGLKMDNCVYSFRERIQKKICTIVYAVNTEVKAVDSDKAVFSEMPLEKWSPEICVEIRGKDILQVHSKSNGSLDKNQRSAFEAWLALCDLQEI